MFDTNRNTNHEGIWRLPQTGNHEGRRVFLCAIYRRGEGEVRQPLRASSLLEAALGQSKKSIRKPKPKLLEILQVFAIRELLEGSVFRRCFHFAVVPCDTYCRL